MSSKHNLEYDPRFTERMSQKLIRIERLRELMDSRGYASVRDFARALGRSDSQISDLLKGRISFGEKVARSIEETAQVPTGWLDGETGSGQDTLYGQTVVALVTIPHVEISAKQGVKGYAVKTIEKPGKPVFFDPKWLDEKGYRPAALYSFTIKDHAMYGRLYEGDVAVYNIDLTQPEDGKVFLLAYDGDILVRRLLRDEGEWWLSCDNPDKIQYPRKKLTPETELIGQIIHKQSDHI